MVGTRKTHSRFKATLYLTACLLFSGCDNNQYTVIDLHFKTGDEIINILSHTISDPENYTASGNRIIISGSAKNTKTAMALIKEIDKPPITYYLEINPNKKNFSKKYTTSTLNPIQLTEGLLTTISLNKVYYEVTITRAAQEASLISLSATKNKTSQQQVNHWIIPHNKFVSPNANIFPQGIKLNTQQPNETAR